MWVVSRNAPECHPLAFQKIDTAEPRLDRHFVYHRVMARYLVILDKLSHVTGDPDCPSGIRFTGSKPLSSDRNLHRFGNVSMNIVILPAPAKKLED